MADCGQHLGLFAMGPNATLQFAEGFFQFALHVQRHGAA